MIWAEATPNEKYAVVRQAVETDGLTYEQAAHRLGAPSKHAIAGVVDRSAASPEGKIRSTSGLKGVASPSKKKRKPRSKSDKPKKKHQGLTNIVPLNTPDETPEPVHAGAWVPLPGSSPIAIADHTDGCRWPVGTDLPFRYCNEDVRAGSTYCAAHYSLSYREPPPRIRFRKDA